VRLLTKFGREALPKRETSMSEKMRNENVAMIMREKGLLLTLP